MFPITAHRNRYLPILRKSRGPGTAGWRRQPRTAVHTTPDQPDDARSYGYALVGVQGKLGGDPPQCSCGIGGERRGFLASAIGLDNIDRYEPAFSEYNRARCLASVDHTIHAELGST